MPAITGTGFSVSTTNAQGESVPLKLKLVTVDDMRQNELVRDALAMIAGLPPHMLYDNSNTAAGFARKHFRRNKGKR